MSILYLEKRTAMTHFNQDDKHKLSAAVKSKIASKYDHQAEEDLRNWIEEVTGLSTGTNFQWGLKNGIILCELINKLQPGSVKMVNISLLNWPQLENISNFIRAIQIYGMKPCDIFEANDLFENKNMARVRSTLVALASLMGTNGCDNQVGMTAYGTRDYLYDPQMQTDKLLDRNAVGLQMDTNKSPGLVGMLTQDTGRDIYDQKVALGPMDSSTISPQMGTNKVAYLKGMSVCELGQQVYDPKYFPAPSEPVLPNGNSDCQAEFPDEYHGQYQEGCLRNYQDSDQDSDD
uniref:Calponin-homology (CH) domain-containing protein n=1 Tax=Vombatus ursinus TaxID=29139 RepID=A0A4X2KW25_VOMUR